MLVKWETCVTDDHLGVPTGSVEQPRDLINSLREKVIDVRLLFVWGDVFIACILSAAVLAPTLVEDCGESIAGFEEYLLVKSAKSLQTKWVDRTPPSGVIWVATIKERRMNNLPLVLAVGFGALLLVAFLAWPRIREYLSQRELERVRAIFHRRREWAEAKFMTLASESGKPRGLAWVDCDFDNRVSFARDRESGQLCALVGVTISFEAVEGGGMEDNPNVGNLRAASAVFRFNGEDWTTDGRAIFNLNPVQAIEHFQNELELVD